MNSLEDVNDVDVTAAYLKIDALALKRLARAGKIGSLRQGRAYTFPREVIETFIEANTVKQTPPNPHGLTDASLRRVRKMQSGQGS